MFDWVLSKLLKVTRIFQHHIYSLKRSIEVLCNSILIKPRNGQTYQAILGDYASKGYVSNEDSNKSIVYFLHDHDICLTGLMNPILINLPQWYNNFNEISP